MTFDPKHPHGHMLRDGRKAELRGKCNDDWVVVVTNRDGSQYVSLEKGNIINAPAPKRSGKVYVYRWGDGGQVMTTGWAHAFMWSAFWLALAAVSIFGDGGCP